MLSEMLENQIIFNLRQLDEGVAVSGSDIECLTSIGTFRNIVGDYVLRSKRVYLFSFQVVNALTFKVGIVLRRFIDEQKNTTQKLVGAFCNTADGYAYFSQGYKRHKTSLHTNQNRIFRGVAPGDIITMVFDSIKGSLSFYVNKEFGSVLFVDERFKNEEFYPAIAVIGDGERLRLTYYDETQ